MPEGVGWSSLDMQRDAPGLESMKECGNAMYYKIVAELIKIAVVI